MLKKLFKKIVSLMPKKIVACDKFEMSLLSKIEKGSKVELDVKVEGFLHPQNKRVFPVIRIGPRTEIEVDGVRDAKWYDTYEKLDKELLRVGKEALAIAKQIADAGYQVSIHGELTVAIAEDMINKEEKRLKIASA